jgi:undecaprenyl phosphate N,N'-diacetylbacillosamine 1-phosphate transferase
MYIRFGKRLFDISGSIIILFIFAPIIILVILIQIFYFKKNIFYTQVRNTRHGKKFKIIKFKTMYDFYDKDGFQLPDIYRTTKFGKILRSTSIDEIPNLFNVLVGQMSIVGPRPLPDTFYDLMSTSQKQRYEVQPGLTGLAQVSGRNNLSWKQKIDMDLVYLKKITFLKDLKIILKTFVVVTKYSKNETLFNEGIDNYKPNFS